MEAISVLLGHVVAAKTNDMAALMIPMAFQKTGSPLIQKQRRLPSKSVDEQIVLHSVAILPSHSGRGHWEEY